MAEQAAVEQEAWGEVRALLEELVVVVVAAAVLVGVVAVAVVGGEVGVGVGGMGVQGRLSCPERESGGGVGAAHGGWKGIRGSPRRRRPGASGNRRRVSEGVWVGCSWQCVPCAGFSVTWRRGALWWRAHCSSIALFGLAVQS